MLFSVGLLAAYLLIMLFNSIFSGIYGSVAIFYATCILGALTLPSMESLFTIIGMSAGWFITGAPVKKVSKRALYLFNGLCIAASCQGKQKRRHKHCGNQTISSHLFGFRKSRRRAISVR